MQYTANSSYLEGKKITIFKRKLNLVYYFVEKELHTQITTSSNAMLDNLKCLGFQKR